MIEFLKISSMAIFDEIAIEFHNGLNCITGETGAGKSLVLGALTLLMGAKASKDLVRPGKDKAVIEALFSDAGRETVLRREIYPTGVNRCYINGKLSTISSLAGLSSGMIHIYGQHEYQDLLNPSEHMKILEEMAGLKRDDVTRTYETLVNAKIKLDSIKRQIDQTRAEREDIRFCLDELKAARIEEGLEERLTKELEVLRSSEQLKNSAMAVQEILYSGAPSVMDLTSQAREHIINMVSLDEGISEVVETINHVTAQVEDIVLVLRGQLNRYEYDPERIAGLEDDVHVLRDLKKKHRTDETGLFGIMADMENKISILSGSEQMTEDAAIELEAAVHAYSNSIISLLNRRQEYARLLCNGINRDLTDLGMPGTRFEIRQAGIQNMDKTIHAGSGDFINPNTVLKGEFMISTNVGQELLPLARIASGGELSRIMLALKVQQKNSQDSTVVFDEIDSGISGQTAFMIAKKLEGLSSHAQLIIVTHLHQVASMADSHIVISKRQEGGTTVSTVNHVTQMDRVMELARMMGGESPSHTVIEHAKELIENRGQEHCNGQQ